jgi:AraC-like DNA-binding protein
VTVDRGVRDGPIVVIPTDAPHEVVDHRDHALVLLVSPESIVGRQLAVDAIGNGRSLDGVQPVAQILGALRMSNWSRADEAVRRTLEHLGVASVEHWPPWWRQRSLDDALLGFADGVALDDVDVSRLADDVGLPVALIAEKLIRGFGVPLGGYVRWLRIVTAIESLVDGADLDEAAAAARFQGADELSRASTSMFGLEPVALAQLGNWLPAP